MVSIVDEDLGVGVGLENWLSTGGGRVSFEDSKEVGCVNLSSRVGNVILEIDILSVWLVEDLSWEWVASVLGNIVIGHEDDVGLWDSVFLHDLVGMMDIRLMSVVAVGV